MQTGQGLIITRGDRVEGISLIYQYDVPPTGPVYSEIGTMRITANGFGIQIFLADLHLLQIRLEEYSREIFPNIFAVVSAQTPSEHNLVDVVGMSEWLPPLELGAERSRAGVPFNPQKRVVYAQAGAYHAAQRRLQLGYVNENLFRTPRGAEAIEVELGWFTPEVLDIVFP
jgi:hypothetical protein